MIRPIEFAQAACIGIAMVAGVTSGPGIAMASAPVVSVPAFSAEGQR